ncbi:uncharacterized protein LOC127861608 [Dreissena polymorpha]|uniref:CARD domain-containing protein n=1 Tax=Dreissena polymorpha TaxID=45954 RepID=A0A9D3YEP4_DREPO|nr:uncharacterized protein LOC127861608 [Dreissena polymorpha]KAH3696859.1 hypothetical protein DPMN_084339 [Dreissena polymorpha]
MEERERGILERNSGLLVGNIVMGEEFFRFLRAEHVLPDTMVNDIKSNKCQVTRNRKLLEVLRLRGGDSYRKFRHVLYLSGHQLLADHLYGEDFETKLWRGDELFSKFPKVFHHVSDDCKSKILKFLETKVKEKAVTNAWLTSSSERLDLMESRKIIFDAEKDYKLKLETKSKKVLQMKDDVTRLTEEIKKRDEELSRMQHEVGLMQKNFKQDLAKQSRFNAANSNSIMHLKCRFDNFNERVRNVNVAIRRFLEPDNVHVDEDPENVKLSALEKNVRKLTLVARTNIETTSSNTNEKEAILSILRTSSKSKNHTLLEIVQHYVDKQEKGKTALGKELEKLLEVVRGNRFTANMSTKPKTDLKYLRNQMATLREEVEHMKKKLEWKDAQITDLIQENSDIKEQTTKQPNSQKTVSFPQMLSNPPGSHGVSRDTPDSTRDMEKAHQQFNRYIEGSTTPTPSRRTNTYRRGSIADVELDTDQPVVLNEVRSRL